MSQEPICKFCGGNHHYWQCPDLPLVKVISVTWANVRGKAKLYPYWEPVVYGLRERQDGTLVLRMEARPLRARRSRKLAESDARGLCTSPYHLVNSSGGGLHGLSLDRVLAMIQKRQGVQQ